MKNLFKKFAMAFALIALVGATACNEKEPNEQPEPGTEDGVISLFYELQSTYQTIAFDELGQYTFYITNTDQIDEKGYPTEVGGMLLILDLINGIDEDPMNAAIPGGTYYTGGMEAWSLNNDGSAAFLRHAEGDGGVSFSNIDGSVHVVNENGQYTITVDAELPMMQVEEGVALKIKAVYKGALNFMDVSTPIAEGFDTPQNVTFEQGVGRYYGNWYIPHSDDLTMTFVQGEVTPEGVLTKGYLLSLNSIYMPKLPDYNVPDVPLAEGVYSVDGEELYTLFSETMIPYQIDPGKWVRNQFGSGYMMTGSSLTYVDKSTDEEKVGLLDSGTMTVTCNGDNYEIVFDFIADNGIALKGSYSGTLDIGNYNDNDEHQVMQDRPWTDLTADHEINFLDNSVCLAYNMGNYLDPAFDQWVMTIVPGGDDAGELIMLQMVVNKGVSEIPAGTYNVSWDIAANSIFPGWFSFGLTTLYSWFGDSTPDEEGYASVRAPIAGGTVELSKDASGNSVFEFNLTDDAGHKITGSWSGPMQTASLTGTTAAAELLNAR